MDGLFGEFGAMSVIRSRTPEMTPIANRRNSVPKATSTNGSASPVISVSFGEFAISHPGATTRTESRNTKDFKVLRQRGVP